jgi:hypothetical protein
VSTSLAPERDVHGLYADLSHKHLGCEMGSAPAPVDPKFMLPDRASDKNWLRSCAATFFATP